MAATTMSLPASGVGSELAYIQETAFGETPATPSLVAVRCLPPSLDPQAEAFISEQINDLRVAAGIRHAYQGAELSIPMELSYGAADEFLAAAFSADWQTDTPSAGIDALDFGSVNKSFTMELARLDAATAYYLIARGVVFTGWDLNISADGNSAVDLSLSAMAASLASATSTADAGSGYTAAPANDPMIAADVSAIQIDASDVEIVGLSLSYADPRSAQRVIGSKNAAGFIPDGRRSLTGTITGYATSKADFDRYLNETESALSATLTDPDGNALTISIPTWKATGYSEGQGQTAIRFEMPFEAYDADGSSPVRITRDPA